MSTLTTLADRVDQSMDLLIDELEKVLMSKIKNLSKQYPSRTFKVVSGHGSLELQVSRRGKGFNLMTGNDDHFLICYQGDIRTTPDRFAVDVFKEVDEISTRFQDYYNGYACLQVDYTVSNGELIG